MSSPFKYSIVIQDSMISTPKIGCLQWEPVVLKNHKGAQTWLYIETTWASSIIWMLRFPLTDPMEKEMATHSSIFTWRIPGTGEPGGLPSMGSHRVGHAWSNLAAAAATQILTWDVVQALGMWRVPHGILMCRPSWESQPQSFEFFILGWRLKEKTRKHRHPMTV